MDAGSPLSPSSGSFWPFHNPHLVEQQNSICLRLIPLKLGGLFFEAFWNTCRARFFWTRGRMMKRAVDGSPGGAIGLGELAEALTLMVIAQDADAIEI